MTRAMNSPPSSDEYLELKKKFDQQTAEIEKLRLKESMLDSLINFIPDNLYFKDTNSQFIALGRTMLNRLGGKNISEVIGKSDFDLFSDEHAKKAFLDEQNILSSGKPLVDIKEKETWEDGRINWVSTSKAPIRNKQGNIIGVFGISRDITQQKLASERLHEANKAIWDQHNLLQTVIDIVPDAIYAKDKNHKFVLSNRTHYSMLGLTDESELLGKTDKDFYDELTSSRIEKEEDEVIRHNLSLTNIEEHRLNPKSLRDIWLSSSKVALNNYKQSGIVCVARDITEMRLTLCKLEHAKNDAEIANQAKNEFLAKMSHEIRTPLNSILGLSQYIIDSGEPTIHLGNVNTIKESADLLLQIIDDLLDFAKIESDALKLENSPFNLRTTIEDLMDIVFFNHKNPDIEVVCIIEEGVPEKLLGDTGRLRQILMNLLGNAKKFTHHGYILLRVSAADIDEEKARIKFSVEDTGIGVDENQKTAIFNSFSQADDSITRQYGGTGLGLAISQKLSHLMGGKIRVISPNKHLSSVYQSAGSTFYFTAQFNTTQVISNTLEKPPHSHKTLLVLACSPLTETSLSIILKNHHEKVIFADSNERAIESINEYPIDIVITNLGFMEANSSIKLSELLKQNQTPVVLLTQPTTPETHHLALPYPFKVINKPIRKAYLLDAIQSLQLTVNVQAKTPEGVKIMSSPFEKLKRMSSNNSILLVEDNPVNQQVAVAILERIGMKVDIAENGQIALNAMKRHDYNLVLMDLQMPVMDGLTATREIRKNSAFKNTPIVALTAQAMKGDLESCLEAGMNDYISKPIQAQHFYKILHQWLSDTVSETQQ